MLQIAGYDFQEIVKLAAHQTAFQNFGNILDGGFENGELADGLLGEIDFCKDYNGRKYFCYIENRRNTTDVSCLSQTVDTLEAWTGRKADIFRDFEVREISLRLHHGQDSEVNSV